MALISFNFAYFLGGQTRKGIKGMGWTVEDVGWDRREGKGVGGRGGTVTFLNWLGYELIKTFSCIACVVHGACMVPNCLWDTSAPAPKCRNILWSVLVQNCRLLFRTQDLTVHYCVGHAAIATVHRLHLHARQHHTHHCAMPKVRSVLGSQCPHTIYSC